MDSNGLSGKGSVSPTIDRCGTWGASQCSVDTALGTEDVLKLGNYFTTLIDDLSMARERDGSKSRRPHTLVVLSKVRYNCSLCGV